MKRLVPIFLVVLAGCVSTMDAAETALVSAHQTLMKIDADFAPLYEQARERARVESDTWEERDAKIEEWERARESMLAAGNALKTTALALSIARDGFDSNWQTQACKLMVSLEELRRNFAAVGVDIPPEIVSVILAMRAAVEGACNG